MILLVMTLASCGSGASPTFPTSTASDVAGRYVLVSANGQTLPVTVFENDQTGFRQEVVGGELVLRVDRMFELRTDYRYTEGGAVHTSSSPDEGTYELSDSVLTLTTRSGRDRVVGSLVDRVVTLRADIELVYRR